MRTTRVIAILSLALLLNAGFSSCKKAEPVAGFSFITDGKTVTFVNESTDADTYLWNFGDNTTSTEQSPAHTYDDYGLYPVTLKATGAGGENAFAQDVEVLFTPVMTIDGDFTKWAAVDNFITGAGGTMTKVKLANDEKYLYVYVEGTDAFRGFFDIYIDSDNNTASGATTWIYPLGSGADYLIEGNIAGTGDADLLSDDPSTDAWSWLSSVAAGSGLIKASALKPITGGKAIEFSIMRERVRNLGTTIHLGFVDIAEDWNIQGGLPLIGGENSALQEYSFK